MMKVLFRLVLTILSLFALSVSPALADRTPGVTETATEILVEAPKFCRLLETKWTLTLTHAVGKDDARDLLLRFIRKEKGQKANVHLLRPDVVEVSAPYLGNETIHIPKDKRIKFVGILATGSPEPKKDNWAYTAYGGKMGSILSDPVRPGIWGSAHDLAGEKGILRMFTLSLVLAAKQHSAGYVNPWF